MSNDDTTPPIDEHDDLDEMPIPKQMRQHIKALEADNKALREQVAEAAAARRKLALIEAGVDLNTPTGQLFAKAYDGELTVEAIKAQAEQYGVVAPPPATTASPAEQQAWQQQTRAQSEGSATGTDWTARFAAATTPDEVRAIQREKMQAEGLA